MKKKIVLILLAGALLSAPIFAKSNPAEFDPFGSPQRVMAGVKIGLLSWAFTVTPSAAIPPLGASVEIPFSMISKSDSDFARSLNLGFEFMFEQWSYDYPFLTSSYSYIYSNSYITLFGAFYYDLFRVAKLKPFAKLNLGYFVASASVRAPASIQPFVGNPTAVSSLAINVSVGARYFFAENFSAVAEIGYGISLFTLGVEYSFGPKAAEAVKAKNKPGNKKPPAKPKKPSSGKKK